MSVRLMTEVWKRFNGTGADLLLALALADISDDFGLKIYPSLKTLAEKTRQDVRTVRRQMALFRASGWLQLDTDLKGGRGRTARYHIHSGWIAGQPMSPLRTVGKEGNASAFDCPAETEKEGNSPSFQKGGQSDRVSPIDGQHAVRVSDEKADKALPESRTPEHLKADTAVSYDPSRSIQIHKTRARARAIPTGSRAAAKTKSPEQLARDCRTLAEQGMCATDIVLVLRQYELTLEQITAWIANGAAHPEPV